ncbi:putative cytochrome P450 [Aspergillus homomorphus CBS 101889]|uniref:Cytochrome P450 n=1 Tax=Aspergillus homomorphus (strain CBS 101889) TaxID=1450537 RepID=A0A395IEL9_ASPHC|nr:hypothetical protein BO97DRAFT_419860 [Aspergillus homomorphus CBS 101889]RAL17623.1 hypothetical protein BO97DRAFT_419860 [Aspergillus homomorphus CBS 101889]
MIELILTFVMLGLRRLRGLWYLIQGPDLIDKAYVSIIQPRFTMLGFEWQNQREVEGTGFVRALRSRLTAHLPALQPDLQSIIQDAIEAELATPHVDGFVHCRLFAMIKRTVTKVNSFTFFGKELAQNPEFLAAALEFPQGHYDR